MLIQRKLKSQVKVIESSVHTQEHILSVFQLIVQCSDYKASLIRFSSDFTDFHRKVIFYYPKCKIRFPTLDALEKPSIIRQYLQKLLPFSRKSNADRIRKYLDCCLDHPVVSTSSVLWNFIQVQREEDVDLTFQLTCATLLPAKKHDFGKRSIASLTTQKVPITPDDFNLIKVLGKGCIGKVLLVRFKRDNKLYALKVIQKQWVIQQKEMAHIRAERDILVSLRHQPFLAHIHHVFQTSSTLFLLLEYHQGGDLATRMSLASKLTPENTRFYAAEIIQGLDVLHSHGIVYRDLKPENVLIGKDGHVVLTDFGLSKIFTLDDLDKEGIPFTHTFCGTAEYLAPEVLLGNSYTFSADFWSFGTLIYEMLSGITPFWADSHMEMYRRVIKEPLVFQSSFDEDTCDLLNGLLKKDPRQRLGWGKGGMEMIKYHPYFDGIDWEQVNNQQLKPAYIPDTKDEIDVSHFDAIFTKLPVRISQSSNVQQDLFDSFDFDSSLIEFQKNNKPLLRKWQTTCSVDDHINKRGLIETREAEILQLKKKIKRHQKTTSNTTTINYSIHSATNN